MASTGLALPVTPELNPENLPRRTASILGERKNSTARTDDKPRIASRQSVGKFQKSEEGKRLLATVHAVVHRLPPELVSDLVRAGIRIAVVPNMDCVPPSHGNDNFVDTLGLFWNERLIFIPQKVFAYSELLDNDEVEFVALQEIGHAFDYMKGYLSETQGII